MNEEANKHIEVITDMCDKELELCDCAQELIPGKSALLKRQRKIMVDILQELACLSYSINKENKNE